MMGYVHILCVLLVNILSLFFSVRFRMRTRNRWTTNVTVRASNCKHIVMARIQGKPRSRFSFEEDEVNYSLLLNRIRDNFDLPSTTELILQYQDKRGELIGMANDDDLKDALVTQALRPLRLTISAPENCRHNRPSVSCKNGGCCVVHVVKAKYRNSVQRLRIGPNEVNFSLLQSRIREMFEISPTALCTLNYVDEDSDSVVIRSDEDLMDALMEQARNPLRLNILVNEGGLDNNRGISYSNQEIDPQRSVSFSKRENDPERVLHHRIVCEGCNTSPLEGPRFKSLKFFSLDLCLKCLSATGANPAEFVKLEKSFYDSDVPQTSPECEPSNRCCLKGPNVVDCDNILYAGESSGSKSREDSSDWAAMQNHRCRDSTSDCVVDPPYSSFRFSDGDM